MKIGASKQRKQPHCTVKRLTALDILLKHHVITKDVYQAALCYGEICHAQPAGGPYISRSRASGKLHSLSVFLTDLASLSLEAPESYEKTRFEQDIVLKACKKIISNNPKIFQI